MIQRTRTTVFRDGHHLNSNAIAMLSIAGLYFKKGNPAKGASKGIWAMRVVPPWEEMTLMNKYKDNYNRLFVACTRQAREYPGMTRAEVAMMLGIKEEAYKKYEYRSPLPTYLIGRFCVLVRCNVEWLVTGQGRRYTPKQGTNSV